MHAGAESSGVLLVAKPAGVTSHDVVERIRSSELGRGRKVGHAGTLDPFATGLLLILIGRATRCQQYLLSLPKRYRAVARFGATSDTGDPDGEITATGVTVDREQVEAGLVGLRGAISQRVPMTSAVKVGGERLYRKARRGEQIETPVRTVNISRLELQDFDQSGQSAELDVECSSGTYVRQLVADLGQFCGAGAYCAGLERTAIGPFELVNADEQRLIGLSEALAFLPERGLTDEEARLVRNGVAVPAGPAIEPGAPVRLTSGGELLAVAELDGDLLKPKTVVAAAG